MQITQSPNMLLHFLSSRLQLDFDGHTFLLRLSIFLKANYLACESVFIELSIPVTIGFSSPSESVNKRDFGAYLEKIGEDLAVILCVFE